MGQNLQFLNIYSESTNLLWRHYYYPIFINEKTEAKGR